MSDLRKEREKLEKKQVYNMIFYFDHFEMVGYFDNVDLEPFRDLLLSCLSKLPEERPSAEDFLLDLKILIKRSGSDKVVQSSIQSVEKSQTIVSSVKSLKNDDVSSTQKSETFDSSKFDFTQYYKDIGTKIKDDDWLTTIDAVTRNPGLLKNRYQLAYITIFIKACMNGHLKSVKKLVELGADVNDKNWNGSNGFLMAALYGCTDVIRFLHSHDNQLIYSTNNNNDTAFTYACRLNLETVKVLVELGSDINHVESEYGRNGLLVAARVGKDDIIKYLHSLNPDLIHAKDKQGRNAIQIAESAFHPKTVKLLKKLGCKDSWFNF